MTGHTAWPAIRSATFEFLQDFQANGMQSQRFINIRSICLVLLQTKLSPLTNVLQIWHQEWKSPQQTRLFSAGRWKEQLDPKASLPDRHERKELWSFFRSLGETFEVWCLGKYTSQNLNSHVSFPEAWPPGWMLLHLQGDSIEGQRQ